MAKRRNRGKTPARVKFSYPRKKSVFQQTTLKIGEVAKKSNIPIVTLRFYEEQGLIKPARNQHKQTSHRRYKVSVTSELEFIKHCRAAGFTLPEIRSMLKIFRGFKPPAKLLMNSIYRTIDRIRNQMRNLEEIERIMVMRLQNPQDDIEALIEQDPEIWRLRGLKLNPD
ncbi:MAG TPA: MerR family transcriptional regulator [Pseudobdellovibrionaceae bacterium]|jgi:DNA-binding transcriptional MerR regulator